MTRLSVNINKVALLRNSRGRNYPDIRAYAERCLTLGADGITLHPRPDQRHARYVDVDDLAALCVAHRAELNVEGYPTEEFLAVVARARPAQCTLVPDAPGQLTSDHGWDLDQHANFLRPIVARLAAGGIRVSLFMDANNPSLELACGVGASRIELYTEPYAVVFGTPEESSVLDQFRRAVVRAQTVGLGVNAGHDLNLDNLAAFLEIGGILEVSIGHALTVEALFQGIDTVVPRYVAITHGAKP